MRGLRFNRGGKNKYGAVPTFLAGIRYDSKVEAAHGAKLELLQKAGEVLSFERQVKIPLEVNGELVTTFRCDFLVHYADGRHVYEEVKGVIAAHSRIKMALFRALFPDRHLVVFKKGEPQ